MKKFFSKDIIMWIIIGIIVIIIALVRNNINLNNDKDNDIKAKIEDKIQQSMESLQKENPDFYLPDEYYMEYKNKNLKAEGIEINNYQMDKNFKNITYTLKNNYDFDILITPELIDEVDNTEMTIMQLVYYDFDEAYKIVKAGEEVSLNIVITKVEREKVNKKDFRAYRVIYKNNEEKDAVGYIEIGGNNK